ncbi:BLUF domain-containing protein [Psychrobacter frigidicola]|uniref:BLUF domain-containing protein n=1 Tax=Psychrobacter frigidicola TaxID=45611 RepID=A0A5C7A145_9GAMM|nr:BLUF domain-containing protein [Psychrobacter frigidicola]TXD96150.1 BLUF domain-containing protein [Psychrobacter frigidicola]
MELELSKFSEKNDAKVRPGGHIILRLTYISHYNPDNAKLEVARILQQAQRNNERNGVTGVLVLNDDFFLQSIEGARPVINELLGKLVEDTRHFSLQVIECREIEQRRWNKWSMKYLTPSEQDKKYVLRFSAGTDFNPYLMSTSQVMMFIDTLSELQEQAERRASEMK